ncbi:MAG TPA: MarR family transcriptional regulator [Streptosporangiaceae bacterium]|nr:MarR family transcriptional regulator [Streptosporangiaceae bacterium]
MQHESSAEQSGAEQSRARQLNAEIQECVFELTGRIIGQAERLAQHLAIPGIAVKALAILDAPMAMKDLGKRMRCDPSFVTAVADTLEKRGLARREAHPGDRRIKNLILTGDGCALKKHLEAELAAWMPWSRALDNNERAQLLALIRKMLSAEPAADCCPGDLSAAAGSPTVAMPADPTAPAGTALPPAPEEVSTSLGVTPASPAAG